MKIFRTFSPALQRNLWILFAAGLLFWAGLAALLPTLPLYIADAGVDTQTIGIVMGSFAIGLLLPRQIFARFADERGRKPVLLLGMMAVAIAPLCYALTQSTPLLIVIRAFHGTSIAAFAIAFNALVADFAPPQHRGEVIGYMSLVNPLGMAIGPAIGGFTQEWFGYTPMFLVTAGLGIVGLLCTMQVQEPAIEPTGQADEPSQPFWGLLGSDAIRVPALVLLLIGLAFGALSTFVPLFIQEVGVDLNVGLFYTTTAIASFGIRIIVGPASDRLGRGLFISLSLILYAIAMTLLYRAHDAVAFLLAGLFEGSGLGILIPMISALMADRSHPHERGRTFGICMVGFDAGIAIAGPVLGAIAQHIGYRGIFGLVAGLAGLSFLIFLTQSSKTLPLSIRFALGRSNDLYAVAIDSGMAHEYKKS